MVKKISVDTVIVGAGIAGLSAALEAKQLGAKVVVLEKLKAARGNTYYSGGGSLFKISAPAEEIAQEAYTSGKEQVNPKLIKRFAENVNESIDWLGDLGLEWFEAAQSTPVSGREGSCIAEDSLGKSRVKGYGRAICRTLVSAVQKRDIDLFYHTRAKKIITDGQGRIRGLLAEKKGESVEFVTRNIVLATGGFQANKEMVKKYLEPSVARAKFSGSPFNTGDGHEMALQLGAQLVNTDQWHASLRNKHRINPYPRLQYGSILINLKGFRFVDEIGNTKDFVAKEMVKQKHSRGAVIFDAHFKRSSRSGFEEHLKEFPVKGIPPVREAGLNQIEEHLLTDGTLIKAVTLRELAERLKVPFDNLEKTIKDYNHSIIDRRWEGIKPLRTYDPVKIETPPYYAEQVDGRFNCTLGGVRINPEAVVIDGDDHPIAGLYAAGEIMGGFYYDNYQVITGYLPVCLVFGRIAGANAARAALQ